jgi:hypothetical protein
MRRKQPIFSYVMLSLLTVLVLSVGQAEAQPPGQPKLRQVVIDSNRQELDNLLLRKPILTTEDNAARQAVLKQINEDFKALQVLNNGVMTEVTAAGSIDYKSIANKISEIGGKASRLRSNLVLPKAETEEKKAADVLTVDDLKQALLEFDKVVMSFTTNPIFQKVNVIEVNLAKQASADLETIIKRSGKLKKAAAKIAKQKAPN